MTLNERTLNILKGLCIQIIMAIDEAAGDKHRTVPDKNTRQMLHGIRSGRLRVIDMHTSK